MTLDPITLEVINNRLREISATMERLLFHSGYSTILRESYDGSAGITDQDGHTVMASGIPIHLFPYSYSTQAIIRNYPLETMRDGDSFILTDPYAGGNLHLPDLVIATPVFVAGQVIAFCVSIAHKPDLGGIVPGSLGAGAREIFHDGLLLPGVRYWTAEGVVLEVEAIVKRNSRVPDAVAGDIRAQVGCTRVGAARLRELCAEYGTDTVLQSFRELQRLAEGRVRTLLSAWQDGEGETEAWVDDDGVDLDKPVRLHVKVLKRGDSIHFDYSGMAAQGKGPMNLRPQASETAALLALLAYLDPTIPINAGTRRPISFTNPEGKITNARWPATVNSYYGLTHVIYSMIERILAEFNPKRAVASAGFGTGGIAVGHKQARARRPAVQYEILVSSLGATPENDGTSVVMGMSHITPNTPVEILETEFPVRVSAFQWVADTAGAGLHRGGPGYRKEYEILDEALFTLRMGHQFKYPGWGVLGGKAPAVASATLNPGTPRERSLRPLETLEIKPGDTVRIEMPGGGGYGNPLARSPERVLEDVLDSYVTIQGAERDYGVAIDPSSMTLDSARTAELRRNRCLDDSSQGLTKAR
jgi:N-methylhydantoinase B